MAGTVVCVSSNNTTPPNASQSAADGAELPSAPDAETVAEVNAAAQADSNNEPKEVTPEAVAEIFSAEGLEHRVEDGTVRSGFINAAIVVAFDSDRLIFESLWRGKIPKDMASHILLATNEHNQTHFAPTLRFFEQGEDHLAISAIRTLDITHGASYNQLGAFIMSSIDTTLQAFDFLATSFPTLVTWEDPHDEH